MRFRPFRRRLWGLTWLALALLVVSIPASARALAPEEPASPQNAAPSKTAAAAAPPVESEKQPLELDNAPEPFVPERAAGAGDRERIEAVSLFAAGRMKEQQEDFVGALRLYERALRHDPNSLAVLEQIVAIAMKLDRQDEALRYAMRAVELDPSDARRLQQMAAWRSARQEFDQALKLVRQAMALQADKKSAGYVVLKLEAGRLFYLTGDPQQAAAAFAEVIEAVEHPDEYGLDARTKRMLLEGRGADGAALTTADRTYEMFGEVFLAADRPEAALDAFEKAQSLKPDAARFAYQQARVQAHRKQPAEALESLKKYFAEHAASQGAGPYELLSQLLAELGRSNEAIPELERLRADDPKNQPLRLYLAEQYLAAKQFEMAQPLFAAVTASAPASSAERAAAYRGLAAVYRQTDASALVKLLGEVVDQTNGLSVLAEQARSLAQDEAAFAKVAAAAQKLLATDAESLGYGQRLAVGLLALEAKRFDIAEAFFNAALKLKSEKAREVLQTWAVALLMAERYEESAQVLKRGIDERVLPADDPTFHYFLAAALSMADKHDEALAAARHAALLNDKNVQVAARVPWILYHAKRYEEAAQAYRELLARFDSDHMAGEVRKELKTARLILSNIAVVKNDLAQAEEWLEQVLDEYPDDISAKNDLGYLWADQGKNLDRALQMVQDAVAAEPENAAYRDSLGWAFYRLGRYDEAVVELKKAAEVDEPDGVILEHLGDAYQAAGQAELARETWRRALEHFEQHDEADKARRTKEKLGGEAEKSSPGTQGAKDQ